MPPKSAEDVREEDVHEDVDASLELVLREELVRDEHVEDVREEGEGRLGGRWCHDNLRTSRTNDARSSSCLLEEALRLIGRVRVTAVAPAAHRVLAEIRVGLYVLGTDRALHMAKVTRGRDRPRAEQSPSRAQSLYRMATRQSAH